MKSGPYKSHYDWLEEHLPTFFEKVGLKSELTVGLLSAHGDKQYGYQDTWEEAGIHFYHGVAICLLSYFKPFSEECRQTDKGWVPVDKWVIANKDRFLPLLPPIPQS